MASRPPKPPHGSPCNGCGQCCEEVLCPLGRHVFGQIIGRCPALGVDAEGRSGCGLVADPREFVPHRVTIFGADVMSAAAAHLVGAGIGCDAQVVGEPADPDFRSRMLAHRDASRMKTALAMRVWGILL